MAKRENGAGSVYRRSDAKERPWVAAAPARYEVDREGNLSKKQFIIGRFATRAEARTALEDFHLHPTLKCNYTLRMLYTEWSAFAFEGLKPQTVTNYTTCWDKICRGTPRIADKTVRQITTGEIRELLLNWQSGFCGKPLSMSYITKIKALLTQLYAYALENNIVDKNYAALVKLKNKGPKTTKRALSELEFAKLENNWMNVPGGDACYVLCYLGFRVSEFCALTPFSYDKNAHALTGGMKTSAGTDRAVPVHHKIQPIVDAWLARGCSTLYADENGKAYNKDTFREKVWKPAMSALGLPNDLTPHSARHTCGTRLSAAGAPPEDIQAILGHEDYSMTANTYINQDISTLQKSVEKMA